MREKKETWGHYRSSKSRKWIISIEQPELGIQWHGNNKNETIGNRKVKSHTETEKPDASVNLREWVLFGYLVGTRWAGGRYLRMTINEAFCNFRFTKRFTSFKRKVIWSKRIWRSRKCWELGAQMWFKRSNI